MNWKSCFKNFLHHFNETEVFSCFFTSWEDGEIEETDGNDFEIDFCFEAIKQNFNPQSSLKVAYPFSQKEDISFHPKSIICNHRLKECYFTNNIPPKSRTENLWLWIFICKTSRSVEMQFEIYYFEVCLQLAWLIFQQHNVSGQYFPDFYWIQRDTLCLSVLSPNTGSYELIRYCLLTPLPKKVYFLNLFEVSIEIEIFWYS